MTKYELENIGINHVCWWCENIAHETVVMTHFRSRPFELDIVTKRNAEFRYRYHEVRTVTNDRQFFEIYSQTKVLTLLRFCKKQQYPALQLHVIYMTRKGKIKKHVHYSLYKAI